MTALRAQTRSGRAITRAHRERADCVVVGSGPAGAAAARELTARGLSVVIVEEGALVAPRDAAADGFSAMVQLYRDLGATVALGRSVLPLVTGRAVGGTSVVNGAISWRLPRDVHAEWCDAD
ncbi:MAG: GMC family oxidoreductase N-terminal domain-containing protein, partial [Myxococcales bacterium]|nr:GMC family oxidoreductase N-terminal domain-containing protein [Myxococcales bacterium]